MQDIPSPQNALVAEAMGSLSSLHYGNGAYFRYNKVSSLPGGLFGQHYGVLLRDYAGGWRASYGISYYDGDTGSDVSALVVTTSAPYVRAEVGGPYRINPNEMLSLDASASYSNCGIDSFFWKIAGKDVDSILSFDTLTRDLGLSAGIYQVELEAIAGGATDYAYTTIEIVPEPASLLLVALGSILAIEKNNP